MVILDKYEEIFFSVFPDLIPDDLSLTDPNWHDDLAHLNPTGTFEVAYFEDIVESWTSWFQSSYFYAYKLPQKAGIYLLFSIEWDDNWNVWQRNPLMAVESDDETTTTVVKAVLKEFARERLDESGNGAWNEFLKSIIDDRLELLAGE